MGRVVLVDDDAALAYALSKELTHAGFGVITAQVVREALPHLPSAEVVVTDLSFGGELAGLELLHETRRTSSAEVVVMTGHGTLEVAVEVMRAGAADLLLKPLDPVQLIASVSRARDRARARRRATEVARLAAMGELTAGVAHEINNPMAFVRSNLKFVEDCLLELMGTVALLNEGRPQDALNAWDAAGGNGLFAEVQHAIDDAVQGADRISALIRDMRQVSRLQDGPRESFPVAEAVELALRLSASELREVQRTVDVSPELWVHADRGRIAQAVMNLVVNAAHAMERVAQKELRISARAEAGWISLEVEDSGDGVPEALRARIFEPFFTTKPAGRGTGLGLPIARQAVQACGGELHHAPRGAGGSVFSLRLPAAEEP